MFGNYLAAALRNLARNRLYAAINIVGLAVGFAAAILIGLFVRDEFGYDSWIPGHQQGYAIRLSVQSPGLPEIEQGPFPDIPAKMKLDFPAIQSVARLSPSYLDMRHGDLEVPDEPIYWA